MSITEKGQAMTANRLRDGAVVFFTRSGDWSEAIDGAVLATEPQAAKALEARGCSVAQLAIARVLARGDDIVPLVGSRTRERLAEALGALTVTLGADDLAAIERAVPSDAAAGERYAATQMAMLDSER